MINSEVFTRLMSPLAEALWKSQNKRACRGLPDEDWLQLGIQRVLQFNASGRAFIQDATAKGVADIGIGHFFEALKSPRRLALLKEVNDKIAKSERSTILADDLFESLHELDDFSVFAGDGHYHKAPIHEQRVNGKKYETLHFYSMNLRTQMMSHLTTGQYGGMRKREHDMHALKRLSVDTLRQGATKGEKVLYIWDKAGMDLRQWYHWKMKGIYFLTREKELNRFNILGERDFDKDDPVNAGVLKDETIGSGASAEAIRRVTYKCPESENIYSYVTNLPRKVRPGVVAFLYKKRWDVEKAYNTFKHKLFEQRAWANSDNAKTMQANFICLAFNLSMIMNRSIVEEVKNNPPAGIERSDLHAKHVKRKKSRIKKLEEKCRKAGVRLSSLLCRVERLVEVPLVFFRWLTGSLYSDATWGRSLQLLASCYAKF